VPTITHLTAQKKNNERISVFVDDNFLCGLSLDDVVKNSLVVGLDVDEEFLSNLLSLSGENDMYNKALIYILRSPRTENEIRQFLSRKKECSHDMTERIIGRLKTMNYINDEAYARMFASAKHVKTSARAIKQKLKNKGVKAEYVELATSDIGDQGELAEMIATKYMRYKDYDEKTLQKLFRYLVSKGFEYDTVNEIVRKYKDKPEIDPETRAEYDTYRNEYKVAKEQLRQARIEAKQSKRKFKTIKKKIVTEMK